MLVHLKIRALRGAVALDVRVDDALHAEIGELPDERESVAVGRFGPALELDDPVARVDGDDELRRGDRHRVAHQRWRLHRRGSEHHPVHTGGERRAHRIQVPDAPSGLHGSRHAVHDARHDRRVRLPPAARTVEVDDVDPPRAQPGPADRHAHRVFGEHRLLRVVALVETHALPVPDVDSRYDFHGPLSTEPRAGWPPRRVSSRASRSSRRCEAPSGRTSRDGTAWP